LNTRFTVWPSVMTWLAATPSAVARTKGAGGSQNSPTTMTASATLTV
jgi:hypothetical protein